MKSLFERVETIDMLLGDLQKIESRIRSGQNVDAYREIRGVMAYVNRSKQELLKNEQNKEIKND